MEFIPEEALYDPSLDDRDDSYVYPYSIETLRLLQLLERVLIVLVLLFVIAIRLYAKLM